MKISSRHSFATRSNFSMSSSWLLTLATFSSFSHAITFNSIPDAGLDTRQLGRVGIAGDFSGISLYQYEGQTEQPFNTNGSEQLLTRLPNGLFVSLLEADASIQTMCSFQGQVILGGNFTSLGGVQSPGIASFDPNTSKVTPIANLSGQVNSLFCDDAADKVYVGGSFRAADSTNAITWLASKNWASLPFAGFNGPVNSITKAPSGHIVFGGSFTGLGNTSTPRTPDGQIINLSTATIQADSGTSTAGFSDPKNIVCKTDGVDGSGNTWLLADNTAGAWKATFNFGFEPTKLRLWNTHQDGRGTKKWRFTAQPINGIMNFTYIDPATQQNLTCTSECPLSDDPSVKFQDFHFVNRIGMNAFSIDVSAWYGNGGGLNGVELFQDDIFAFAINDFNEPSCANTSTPSTATATGPWSTTTSGQSNSQYLSAELSKPVASDAASVVFYPDIRESGEYIIKLYTPGCLQDNTCSTRGQVNVSGTLSASGTNRTLASRILYQTNEFDKYDQLHIGSVDASSSSFRPSITLTPVPGQAQSIPGDNFVMVAQRVGFELLNSTGGLNGLFEYDPSSATIDTSNFSSSAFVKLGSSFSNNSAVASLVATSDRTFVGGNFTSDNVQNIVAIDNNGQTIALDGGLNGEVLTMHLDGNQLFVGGRFNNTRQGSTSGLGNVAVYDSTANKWTSLGAGVDGAVISIVSTTLNLSSSTAEDVLTLTGDFSHLLAFGSNTAVEVSGFAIWVKSQSNWLQNLNTTVPLVSGVLSTSLALSGNETLYAGSISSQLLQAYGAATFSDGFGKFPINIQPSASISNSSTSGLSKRASLLNSTATISGVVTGAFYENDGRNITILGGHFVANASNGSTIYNLALIDGANSNTVTGLGTEISVDSVFLSLAVQGDNLYAGGRVNGTAQGSDVNGLISYNLASKSFNNQPPALVGDNVTVSSVNVRPDSSDVYVGGSFDRAGSLPCPSVCLFSTSTNQWNRPGFELGGDVNSMMWSSKTVLFAGGNLTINDTATYLASYDASGNHWTAFSGASDLPGPVIALTAANGGGDEVWVAGTEPNGSTYLMKYDGSSWKTAAVALDQTSVVSSLQMFTITGSHDSSDLIASDQVLLLTGSIGIPGFGTASSAIFNGTTVQPFALTSKIDGTTGSISRIFVEKDNFFATSSSGMPRVFVALIGLAISLGIMVLIVLAGLALDRYRKKREGYIPAPTSMFDRGSGIQRIPPHELLHSLNQGRPGAPTV
ncbi:cortical protein marker for cell polarity-domain-containing protein [Annulohypoxylon maeteangense]|uniref:cortical protein marker for cell polarity-domain-containing protein n=1 Tax=Annulohypoxylon maeteangense TaxID=1927788 RepID=UPI0020073F9B|nr:cortical protein marker for cell polarity-domain-containing protein [Annulohypoxylon maeteangense]KAI0889893.1 cortical protein marker for cell polarity-domain-containing protein [Annulohypoxylon maeteangense]